ncbi:hypothetical protein [Dyadobacter aurulentus]|uniref:hypothetical protein n=1 Tax=Dyadobacter sp. UC 10 TaxID=2605428 RepID=UPI0011F1E78D|nr:hypothetical protein [Dyadobacter sp. UC 10]KAA0991219.1 hypothetical protein FXO21_14130 [Dyadobacter sp. UC 10]
MPNIEIKLLAAILVASIQVGAAGKQRPFRQPYPEQGFWVVETLPESDSTIVRYYATSIDLVSEQKEKGKLDVSKRSTRKYLNKKLSNELEKGPLGRSIPKLYEIN